jgi:hypothetical protein
MDGEYFPSLQMVLREGGCGDTMDGECFHLYICFGGITDTMGGEHFLLPLF